MKLMLRYAVVVVTVLAELTTATPPVDNVQRDHDGKISPSYRYKYEVEDDFGTTVGKLVIGDDENSRDEYHPSLEYFVQKKTSPSDEATEKLTQPPGNEKLDKSEPRAEEEEEKSLVTDSSRSKFNWIKSSTAKTKRPSKPKEPATSSAIVNYVTVTPIPSAVIELITPSSSSIDVKKKKIWNIESEDEIVLENIGNFGQKLKEGKEEEKEEEEGKESVIRATTARTPWITRDSDEPNLLQQYSRDDARSNPQVKAYLSVTKAGLLVRPSTIFPIQQRKSATANSIDINDDRNDNDDDDKSSKDTSRTRAYSTSENSIVDVNFSTTSPDPLSTNRPSATRAGVSLEASKNTENPFVEPIIVSDDDDDTSRDKSSFQYSTTFKCEDDESAQPSTASPLVSFEDALDEAVREEYGSRVSVPIQSRASHFEETNATDVGTSSSSSSSSVVPAPVSETVDDIPRVDEMLVASEDADTDVAGDYYVGMNPAFGEQSNDLPEDVVRSEQQQQQVEILKSVEIYRDDSRQQQSTIGDQKSENSTKIRLPGGGSIIDDRPIFVLPPATYLIDNGSYRRNKYYQSDKRKVAPSQQIPTNENRINEKPAYNPIRPVIFVEKKVPHAVEKILPQTTVSQFVTLPIAQPISAPNERIVDMKVPYPPPVIRLPLFQSQPYPVAEKTAPRVILPMGMSIEPKFVQRYPYRMEKLTDKNAGRNKDPKESTYGVRYGVSYQQIMKPKNRGLFSTRPNSIYPLSSSSAYYGNRSENNNNNNYRQSYHDYGYGKPSVASIDEKTKARDAANSILNNYRHMSNSMLLRRHAAFQRLNKDERDSYIGPVPSAAASSMHRQLHRQLAFRMKDFGSDSSMRKSSNKDSGRAYPYKGNFRQSKIEYGFKPPMVPSVQYDEETASKVES